MFWASKLDPLRSAASAGPMKDHAPSLGNHVTKVFLLSSFRRPEEDTHWASPYFALRRSFDEKRSPACLLVDSPADADLIVICPRPRNPVFPAEIFRGGIAWKYRHKCVVVSTDDNPTITHKGFYTSIGMSTSCSPFMKGGFYPSITYEPPDEPFPVEMEFRYLFSFLGSFATHPVRQRIGTLASEWSAARTADLLVKDTTWTGASERTPVETQAFREDYLDALRDSKFILCPRGKCPTSLRLFESMKARRVPVVIADEWVRPPEVQWDEFAIVIKERDVREIPRILASEESSFAARATAAWHAWDHFFSRESLADTVTRWGASLVSEANRGTGMSLHTAALARQVLQWRFLRRGIGSELWRRLRSG
jgi:hypothetical protein